VLARLTMSHDKRLIGLRATIEKGRNRQTDTYTRGWIVWRVLERALHHGGECGYSVDAHGFLGLVPAPAYQCSQWTTSSSGRRPPVRGGRVNTCRSAG
jgi:hypothetical protein